MASEQSEMNTEQLPKCPMCGEPMQIDGPNDEVYRCYGPRHDRHDRIVELDRVSALEAIIREQQEVIRRLQDKLRYARWLASEFVSEESFAVEGSEDNPSGLSHAMLQYWLWQKDVDELLAAQQQGEGKSDG